MLTCLLLDRNEFLNTCFVFTLSLTIKGNLRGGVSQKDEPPLLKVSSKGVGCPIRVRPMHRGVSIKRMRGVSKGWGVPNEPF